MSPSRCQALLFALVHLLMLRQRVTAMRKTISADELSDSLSETGQGVVVEVDGVHEVDALHGDRSPPESTFANRSVADLKTTIWNHPMIKEYRGEVMETRFEMMLILALLGMACLPLWAFSSWYLESATKQKECPVPPMSNDGLTVSSKMGQAADTAKTNKSRLEGIKFFNRPCEWPCLFAGSKGERMERVKVEADKLIKMITMRSFLLSLPPLNYDFDDVFDIEGDGSDGEDVEDHAEESTNNEIAHADGVTGVAKMTFTPSNNSTTMISA